MESDGQQTSFSTNEEVMNSGVWTKTTKDRRYFIGGSDARTIMGDDEAALLRLWREKRGEVEAEDFSGNLIVQLGVATEDLNRRWYEANSGQVITNVQQQVRHPALRWMAATLDGRVEATGAVFEAKFMLPWSFTEDGAAEKYMPQLQHNMWITNAKTAIDHHRWRQMGGDYDRCRLPLPVPPADRREKVLVLCPERRVPSPLRR
jgi:predicted phage-related endonuclease